MADYQYITPLYLVWVEAGREKLQLNVIYMLVFTVFTEAGFLHILRSQTNKLSSLVCQLARRDPSSASQCVGFLVVGAPA